MTPMIVPSASRIGAAEQLQWWEATEKCSVPLMATASQ